MPISEPYEINEGQKKLFAVLIRRRNGTCYQVKSEDLESIKEYRAEYLAVQSKKRTR